MTAEEFLKRKSDIQNLGNETEDSDFDEAVKRHPELKLK